MGEKTRKYLSVADEEIPDILYQDWQLALGEEEKEYATEALLYLEQMKRGGLRAEHSLMLGYGNETKAGTRTGRFSVVLTAEDVNLVAIVTTIVSLLAGGGFTIPGLVLALSAQFFKIRMLDDFERCIFAEFVFRKRNNKQAEVTLDELKAWCEEGFQVCEHRDKFKCNKYIKNVCRAKPNQIEDTLKKLCAKGAIAPTPDKTYRIL